MTDRPASDGFVTRLIDWQDSRRYRSCCPDGTCLICVTDLAAEARRYFEERARIQIVDLDAWLDHMRPILAPNEWARAQGAVNGLRALLEPK